MSILLFHTQTKKFHYNSLHLLLDLRMKQLRFRVEVINPFRRPKTGVSYEKSHFWASGRLSVL